MSGSLQLILELRDLKYRKREGFTWMKYFTADFEEQVTQELHEAFKKLSGPLA